MIRPRLEALLRTIDELESVDFEKEKTFVSSGLIDSFSVLLVVSKIEQEFQVEIELQENLNSSLDSIEQIEKLILNSKKK
ncbi:MAG: phosphopantetheine-binding protein [Bacteriovoracaceae bacterium]